MLIAKETIFRDGGSQTLYRFDNGYGASVINHSFSYGMELAVTKYSGPHINDFDLCYDTSITNDVIGHLNEDKLAATLQRIDELTPHSE